MRTAAKIGGWTLLENLESAYHGGHYREVWHELMIKYRGLLPEIVAGERFHRLFIAVGSDIVAREDLTPEQAQDMAELLSCAQKNLQGGRVTSESSMARFAKPLLIAWLLVAALSAGIKIFDLVVNHH